METSITLLNRLRDPADSEAWTRLTELYGPLLRAWIRKDATLNECVEDLVQDVLLALCQSLPAFNRQRAGSFRRWLRTITAHRLLMHYRKRGVQRRVLGSQQEPSLLEQLADDGSDLAQQWDQEHFAYLRDRLLEFLARDTQFGARSIEAFRRTVIEDQPDALVAADLGMTVNSVTLARVRILKRLRDEGDGLFD